MTQTFKKGDKVECTNADGAQHLVKGKIYEVFYVTEYHLHVVNDCGVTRGYYSNRFKPAQPFSLANTKINVQKYAEENGLTFKAACSEVSEWAVSQGYNWCNVSPVRTFSFLFTDTFVDKELTYSESRRYFDDHPNKEITLSRKVTVELTPSFVEPEKPAVEYVELGGKRYVKSELEEALSKIKAVEE